MATRKRTGFRPRKATKRMGCKANKRTRKNVLTGGSKPPAPPLGPAPNFKVIELVNFSHHIIRLKPILLFKVSQLIYFHQKPHHFMNFILMVVVVDILINLKM
jgi:hypothetical protein